MDLEYKSSVGGVKVLDEGNGIVQAIVSVTNVVDNVKDNILPGAYRETLTRRTPKGLRGHDWQRMVAKTLHSEELMPNDPRIREIAPRIYEKGGGGLLIRGQYNLNTQIGRDAYEDAKFFGDDMEWSVGYKVPQGKSAITKLGVREIKMMDLYEWSDVAFGAAPLTAGTTSVKSAIAGMIAAGELSQEEIAEWVQLAEGEFAIDGEKGDSDGVVGVLSSIFDGLESECDGDDGGCGCEGCLTGGKSLHQPGDDGFETKDKVSSAAGVRKYHAPVGTPIVPGMGKGRGVPGKPGGGGKGKPGSAKGKPSTPEGRGRSPFDNKPKGPGDLLQRGKAKDMPPRRPATDKDKKAPTPYGAGKGKAPVGDKVKGKGKLPDAIANFKVTPEGKKANDELNPSFPGVSKMGPPDVTTDNVEEALTALAEGKKVELSQPKEVSSLLNRLNEIVNDAKSRGEKAPDYNLCNVSVKGSNIFCAEHKDQTRLTMPQLTGPPRPGSKAEGILKEQNDAKLKAWKDAGKDEAGFQGAKPWDGGPSNEADLADAYREYLKSLGLTTTEEDAVAAELKASQKELVGGNVAGMMSSMENTNPDGSAKDPTKMTMPPGRIFVSQDNYVLDGHHRWAAQVGLDFQDNQPGDISMPVETVNANILDLLSITTQWTTEMGVPPKGGGKGSAEASAAAAAALAGQKDVLGALLAALEGKVDDFADGETNDDTDLVEVVRDELAQILDEFGDDITDDDLPWVYDRCVEAVDNELSGQAGKSDAGSDADIEEKIIGAAAVAHHRMHGARKVRTAEGARYYGLPIGSPIRPGARPARHVRPPKVTNRGRSLGPHPLAPKPKPTVGRNVYDPENPRAGVGSVTSVEHHGRATFIHHTYAELDAEGQMGVRELIKARGGLKKMMRDDLATLAGTIMGAMSGQLSTFAEAADSQEGMEGKAFGRGGRGGGRRVRTPEGVQEFHAPIGSPIVPGMGHAPHMAHHTGMGRGHVDISTPAGRSEIRRMLGDRNPTVQDRRTHVTAGNPMEDLTRLAGGSYGRPGRGTQSHLDRLQAALSSGDADSAERALQAVERAIEDDARSERRELSGGEIARLGAVRRQIRALKKKDGQEGLDQGDGDMQIDTGWTDEEAQLADTLAALDEKAWGELVDQLHDGGNLWDVKEINDLADEELKGLDADDGDFRALHVIHWAERFEPDGYKDDEAASDVELMLVADGQEFKVSSRSLPSLDRSPKENWVDKVGGLPSYIERIAKHLHSERGMTISHAIAAAINRVKKWAAGGQNVSPETRAKAAKAVAEWEAKKAKSRAKTAARKVTKTGYDTDLELKREFSSGERDKAAEKGAALPDGSFPIKSEQDLKNAMQAIGRAKDKAAARAHIIKRARALGLTDQLPDGWTGEKADDTDDTEDKNLMGMRMVGAAGRGRKPSGGGGGGGYRFREEDLLSRRELRRHRKWNKHLAERGIQRIKDQKVHLTPLESREFHKHVEAGADPEELYEAFRKRRQKHIDFHGSLTSSSRLGHLEEAASGVRKVRTSEGSRKYKRPIGSPIVGGKSDEMVFDSMSDLIDYDIDVEFKAEGIVEAEDLEGKDDNMETALDALDEIFPGLDLKMKKHRFMGKGKTCAICHLSMDEGKHIGADEPNKESEGAAADRNAKEKAKAGDDKDKDKWVPPWKKTLETLTDHDVAEMVTLVDEWYEQKTDVETVEEDEEEEGVDGEDEEVGDDTLDDTLPDEEDDTEDYDYEAADDGDDDADADDDSTDTGDDDDAYSDPATDPSEGGETDPGSVTGPVDDPADGTVGTDDLDLPDQPDAEGKMANPGGTNQFGGPYSGGAAGTTTRTAAQGTEIWDGKKVTQPGPTRRKKKTVKTPAKKKIPAVTTNIADGPGRGGHVGGRAIASMKMEDIDLDALEAKAGRVLSGNNAKAIRGAMEQLTDVLKRAGVDLADLLGEGEGEGDAGAAGAKSDDLPDEDGLVSLPLAELMEAAELRLMADV